jgi:hypothetical protein
MPIKKEARSLVATRLLFFQLRPAGTGLGLLA